MEVMGNGIEMMESDWKRHIPLTGARNFRDFGGYATRDGRTIRRGLLYRADSLSQLSPDDLATLSPLGIRTIGDLRRHREREASPSRWCDEIDTRVLHLPLLLDTTPGNTGAILADARRMNSAEASRDLMKATYRRMVTDPHALAQLRTIFELIAAREQLPLLLHCSGGKDRTGICCALIQTLLDVDEESIMADYMLSLDLYTNRMARTQLPSTQVVDTGNPASIDDALRPIYAVEPGYLHCAFETIAERYGTPARFFERAVGLRSTQIDAIRSHLTA